MENFVLGAVAGGIFGGGECGVDYNRLLEDYSHTFPDNPAIQEILNKKIEELIKNPDTEFVGRRTILRSRKIVYIGIIIEDLRNFIKRRGIDHADETKKELEDFKTKLDNQETKTFEGKMKLFIEYYFSNYHKYLKKGENVFLIDKKGNILYNCTRDKKLKMDIKDPQVFIEKYNDIFIKLAELRSQSNGSIKDQIGILYEVIINPKESLILYKHELMGQPWYKGKLAEHGLDRKS